MSKQQYLSDDDMHWHPHMMWFVPGDSVQSWGAKGDDVPVYADSVLEDPMTIFMIPVDHWSGGTPATTNRVLRIRQSRLSRPAIVRIPRGRRLSPVTPQRR